MMSVKEIMENSDIKLIIYNMKNHSKKKTKH